MTYSRLGPTYRLGNSTPSYTIDSAVRLTGHPAADRYAQVPGAAPGVRYLNDRWQIPEAALACEARRMVLFPFGQPEALKHRGLCVDFVIHCSGDVGRIIDAPNDTIEQFGAYVSRIRGLREGAEHALVVVARSNPLALVASDARRRLESWVPALRQALWMMYLDPEEEPDFLSTAERFGRLTGPLDTAPIWVGPGLTRFIVASPLVTNLHRVADRINEIDRDRSADARRT